METERTAEQLLDRLMSGGAVHAFVRAEKMGERCVRASREEIREISSGETLEALVRLQSDRTCFEKNMR